ncbi:hypothetical protein WOLCODRAFT_122004 [Wolfiporia cocos MD-104 SS10]|uniref:Uncharacterized protein n=1 Tax=Wolfiporia cocos (strain MD-104) TaxID=742152 RepID=A0A2H3JMT0_WOLCO|nr:hypothetical protein WOLCODRAFT_122004 [Wolfiporia cocos MD-104 SS10]
MSQPHAQREHPPGEPPSLRDRVEDLVHKAFWDEAFESLSNPSPAVQLPRLKKLYEDMHIALKPLLPPDHPVLITLSSPLPPTPAPLRSAILHLREVLVCLRQRSAPARDTQIDSLIAKIDDLSSVASLEQQARLAVGTIQSILELSEAMKDDLSLFVLGTMGERQLREVLRTRAIDQEREIVSELWKSEAIQDSWTKWLSEAPTHATLDQQVSHRMWVYRLVHALGQTVPVSLPFPAPPLPSSSPSAQTEEQPLPSNIIPPPLFFVCSTLLYIQNYLQALVIAASLRSLVRLPPMRSSSPTSQPDPLGNFMTRIWTLLKAEIDVPDASETKLVNLADEVIRVRRLFGSGEAPSADEETRLRAAVDRTLQPRDPVFLLLQRRLLQAVAARLARSQERDAETAGTRLPESLQSGRERPGKRPRLMLQSDARDDHGGSMESSEPSLVIKGFEDEVLIEAVRECVGKLRSCVDWVEEGWSDVIIASVHTHPASG